MTTKKFKSLQEPKGIWVCEYNDNGKWFPSTWNIMGTTEAKCLLQFKKTFPDSWMDISLYRFRRYVSAPARKTRKK